MPVIQQTGPLRRDGAGQCSGERGMEEVGCDSLRQALSFSPPLLSKQHGDGFVDAEPEKSLREKAREMRYLSRFGDFLLLFSHLIV